LAITPDNRASIRSAARELPLAAYIALAAVPAEQMENPATRRLWEAVVRALGNIQHGGAPAGKALAKTDYPEPRISALLRAHGQMQVDLIEEAIRWLVSHDIKRCSLTALVVLCLADICGDLPLRDQTCATIALSYAREQRRKQAAARRRKQAAA
jgi:hypothetical protein